MVTCHLIAALLLLGFPLWDRWEARQLREAAHPQVKTSYYLRGIAGLWLVSFGVILCLPLRTLWPAPAGETFPFSQIPSALSQGFIYLMIFTVALPPVLAILHRGLRRRMLVPYESFDFMLPRTPREQILFALVSISAGICEEIIYRGFLLRYLHSDPWGLSLGWSLLASAAIFGLAHAGQGAKGMLGTGLIGLVLGWLYLASGSLLIPIIVHALIDLRALVMAMLREPSADAPTPERS